MDEEKRDELQEGFSDIEQRGEQPEEAAAEEKPAEEKHQPKPELPKKFADQPKKIGAKIPKMQRLRTFIIECKRVLRVTRKPDKKEFTTIVKISSAGMAIVGVIGFIIHFIKELLL